MLSGLWTFLALVFGGTPLFLALPFRGGAGLLALDAPGWLAILFLAIACTLLGFSLWVWILRHIPASSAGFAVFLNPPLTALSKVSLAALWPAVFRFEVSAREWLGGTIVLAGTAIALLGRRRGAGQRAREPRHETVVLHPAPVASGSSPGQALLAHVLGRTRGYRHHPQLARFQRRNPVGAISTYLWAVQDKAEARLSFDAEKIARPRSRDVRRHARPARLRVSISFASSARDRAWLGRVKKARIRASHVRIVRAPSSSGNVQSEPSRGNRASSNRSTPDRRMQAAGLRTADRPLTRGASRSRSSPSRFRFLAGPRTYTPLVPTNVERTMVQQVMKLFSLDSRSHLVVLACLLLFGMPNAGIAHVRAAQGTPGESSHRWSAPLRLTPRGAYPALSYSATHPGDLRVFYVVLEASVEKMVFRTRFDGAPFGPQTNITDSSGWIDFGAGARAMAIHDAPGTLDLALSKSSVASILMSTDGGVSWEFQRSFSNTGDATLSYLPVHFTDDAPDRLRFLYGYVRTLVVTTDFAFTTQRACPVQQGGWCAGSQLYYDDHGNTYPAIGPLERVHEDGSAITILDGGTVYHSSDNGASYAVIEDPRDPTVALAGADLARLGGSRLLLVQPFTHGAPPHDHHLRSYSSNDFGATWNQPVPIVTGAADPIPSPLLAANGATLVLVWKHADASTSQHYQILKCLVSQDDGATWTPLETGIALTGTQELADLALANDRGRFSLAYSLVNGATWAGVYFTELVLP